MRAKPRAVRSCHISPGARKVVNWLPSLPRRGPSSQTPLNPPGPACSSSQVHGAGRLAPAHRGVMGEGNVAHIEHVLQQGQGVIGKVAEGVLHQPAGGRLLQHRDQGQRHRGSRPRLPREHEQQPLASGGGIGTAGAAQLAGLAAGAGLGDGGAAALTVERPAVVRTLQLTGGVDPPLGERHQAVGADVGEGPPPATGLLRIARPLEPEHEVVAEEGESRGPGRIQITQEGHRVPGVPPGGAADGRRRGHRGRFGAGAAHGTDVHRGPMVAVRER